MVQTQPQFNSFKPSNYVYSATMPGQQRKPMLAQSLGRERPSADGGALLPIHQESGAKEPLYPGTPLLLLKNHDWNPQCELSEDEVYTTISSNEEIILKICKPFFQF